MFNCYATDYQRVITEDFKDMKNMGSSDFKTPLSECGWLKISAAGYGGCSCGSFTLQESVRQPGDDAAADGLRHLTCFAQVSSSPIIWRFPEIGVPPNHLISPFLGDPHLWKSKFPIIFHPNLTKNDRYGAFLK